jgi:DNA-directed RNA polymerase subunit RPC12/RpoP
MTSPERLRVDSGDSRQITRQRRGRPIRCPRCLTSFETMRRFQLQCPNCGHSWQEKSKRSVIDWLLDGRDHVLGGGIWLLAAGALVLFIAWVVYAVAIGISRIGAQDAIGIGLVVGGLLAFVILVSRQRHYG